MNPLYVPVFRLSVWGKGPTVLLVRECTWGLSDMNTSLIRNAHPPKTAIWPYAKTYRRILRKGGVLQVRYPCSVCSQGPAVLLAHYSQNRAARSVYVSASLW